MANPEELNRDDELIFLICIQCPVRITAKTLVIQTEIFLVFPYSPEGNASMLI
jgi:hypothetical protein